MKFVDTKLGKPVGGEEMGTFGEGRRLEAAGGVEELLEHGDVFDRLVNGNLREELEIGDCAT